MLNLVWVSSSDKANVLHIMFHENVHDFMPEAKILQRILDGGADINLWSPKWGVPIYALMSNVYLSGPEVTPFYDVIFSHPGINWDAYVRKIDGERYGLQRFIDLKQKNRPELHRRMHHYLEHGPAPRPTFN